jgi:hypothetical protein
VLAVEENDVVEDPVTVVSEADTVAVSPALSAARTAVAASPEAPTAAVRRRTRRWARSRRAIEASAAGDRMVSLMEHIVPARLSTEVGAG